MQKMRRPNNAGGNLRGRSENRGVPVLMLTAMIGLIAFLAAGSVAFSATRTSATVSLRTTKLGQILVGSDLSGLDTVAVRPPSEDLIVPLIYNAQGDLLAVADVCLGNAEFGSHAQILIDVGAAGEGYCQQEHSG